MSQNNDYIVSRSVVNRSTIYLNRARISSFVHNIAASRQTRAMISNESTTPIFSKINKSCHNCSRKLNTQFWVNLNIFIYWFLSNGRKKWMKLHNNKKVLDTIKTIWNKMQLDKIYTISNFMSQLYFFFLFN